MCSRDWWRSNRTHEGPERAPKYFEPSDVQYSAFAFTDRLVKVIGEHNVSRPLFLYAAYQSIHGPLEVPDRFLDMYRHQDVHGVCIECALSGGGHGLQ